MNQRIEKAFKILGAYPLSPEDTRNRLGEEMDVICEQMSEELCFEKDTPLAQKLFTLVATLFGIQRFLAIAEQQGVDVALMKDMYQIELDQLYTVSRAFADYSKELKYSETGVEHSVEGVEVDGEKFYTLKNPRGEIVRLANHVDQNPELAMNKWKGNE